MAILTTFIFQLSRISLNVSLFIYCGNADILCVLTPFNWTTSPLLPTKFVPLTDNFPYLATGVCPLDFSSFCFLLSSCTVFFIFSSLLSFWISFEVSSMHFILFKSSFEDEFAINPTSIFCLDCISILYSSGVIFNIPFSIVLFPFHICVISILVAYKLTYQSLTVSSELL